MFCPSRNFTTNQLRSQTVKFIARVNVFFIYNDFNNMANMTIFLKNGASDRQLQDQRKTSCSQNSKTFFENTFGRHSPHNPTIKLLTTSY